MKSAIIPQTFRGLACTQCYTTDCIILTKYIILTMQRIATCKLVILTHFLKYSCALD